MLHRLDEVGTEVAHLPEGEESISEAHIRFAAVLGKVASLVNDEKLLAPLDSTVTPLSHQIKVLKKILSRQRVRFLLANPLFPFLMRAFEGIVTEGEKANS